MPNNKEPKTIKNFFIWVFTNLAFLVFCLFMGYVIAYNAFLSVISPYAGAVVGFIFWFAILRSERPKEEDISIKPAPTYTPIAAKKEIKSSNNPDENTTTRAQYLSNNKHRKIITYNEFVSLYEPIEAPAQIKPFYTWSKLQFSDGSILIPTFIYEHKHLTEYVNTKNKIENFASIVII